jgi:methanesulfonate monooxygenase large subunit
MPSRDTETWQRAPAVPDTHYVSGLVYSDPEIFEEERSKIFGKVWALACHESELPKKFDFRTIDYAGTPIIVTRGGDGRVRSFVNVCSHRGAKLVNEVSGNTRRFICFYHQWAYDSEGACVGIPQPDAYNETGLRAEDCGLREVRTDSKYGLIFINLSDEAPTLNEFIGDALEPLSPMLTGTELEVFHYQRSEINANWKAWMETNLDTYHGLMHVLLRKTQVNSSREITLFLGGHAATGGSGQKYGDYGNWAAREESLALPGIGANEMKNGDLFPNFTILCRGTVIRIDTVTPISPHRALVECRGLGVKGESESDRHQRIEHHNQYWGFAGRNWPEDAVAAERCEATFGSGAARHQIIAREENLRGNDDGMLRGFYAEWSRMMGRPANNPFNRS